MTCLLPSCPEYGRAGTTPQRRYCDECGQPLGGRRFGPEGGYVLDAWLGSGYYANVYRATDRQSGDACAIKVYGPGPDKREAARREREALATLRHPRLPALRGAFDHGDQRFVVMELIGGPNLRDLVEECGPLPTDRAIAIAVDVGDALAYVASRGWTYRDLHPRNIHPNTANGAMVLDWDNARPPGFPAAVAGRAGYRAPELEANGEVTPACDVYGLAGCAFFALTGADPPEAPGDLPTLPGESGAQRDSALADILKACRRPDPARRPTAAALRTALLALASRGAGR